MLGLAPRHLFTFESKQKIMTLPGALPYIVVDSWHALGFIYVHALVTGGPSSFLLL